MRKIRQLQNSRKSYSPLTRLWRNTRKTCATYETFLVTILSWIIPSLFSVQMTSFFVLITFPIKTVEENLYTLTSSLFPLVILFWLFYDSQLPMMFDQYLQRITALWFCAALILLSAFIFEPIYLFPRICIYFVLWWAVYVVLVGYLQKLMSRSLLRPVVSDYQKQEIVQFLCWRLGTYMLFTFYILPWVGTEQLIVFLFPPYSSQSELFTRPFLYYYLASLLWIANRIIAHNLRYYPDLLFEDSPLYPSTPLYETIKAFSVYVITVILSIIHGILLLIFGYSILVIISFHFFAPLVQ